MGNSSKIFGIEERLQHLKVRVPKVVGGKSQTQALVQTIHKAGLSMLLDKKNARTGNMFQIPLPNSAAKCVDDIAKKVRDLFPASVPMVITVHTGDDDKNLHLQGWFSEKPWNADNKSWGSPLHQFRTKEGLSEFRGRVDKVLSDFEAVWSKDPEAPKRTVFHPAKSQFMKSMSHAELLKGDFLETVQNPKLKQCLTEEVEIARYHDAKRHEQVVKSVQAARRLDEMLEINEIYQPILDKGNHQSTEEPTESKNSIVDSIIEELAQIESKSNKAQRR